MRKILMLCMALMLCIDTFAVGTRLFFVSRNLNRNVINYDVQLVDGKLNVKEPMHVYWYNLEKNPVTTNELNFIQRKMAYGYSVDKAADDEAWVKLKAYGKRLVKICKHNDTWVAVVTIDGVECVLKEIYAHCPSRTSCDYLELRGKSITDGREHKEKVK